MESGCQDDDDKERIVMGNKDSSIAPPQKQTDYSENKCEKQLSVKKAIVLEKGYRFEEIE